LTVLGLGVDAVDIERFRKVLSRRPSIAQRLFTADERGYAERSKDPTARLAVRFAAKEAALKALGCGIGSAPFREFEVMRGEDGEPRLCLHGDAARLAKERGVDRWHLSLTHTETVAVASAIAEGADGAYCADGAEGAD
jgi:holo-[acyl-carrier protein] synthase